MLQSVEVFHSAEGHPYGCTLNFTDVRSNSNKYYIIQLLKTISAKEWYLFTRWGRVGEKGRWNVVTMHSQHSAVTAFMRSYRKKTSNSWGDPKGFEPRDGKYYRLEMAKIDVEEEEVQSGAADVDMEDAVRDVIVLISDTKIHMQALQTFNIDTKKMPLGKISDPQIDKAYRILFAINAIIEAVENGTWERSRKILDLPVNHVEEELLELSSRFWTNVPYSCGWNRPPVVDTLKFVERLTELLEVMKNAEIAGKITRRFNNVGDIYLKMNAGLEVVKDPNERRIVTTFVTGTHAPTHQCKIEVLEAFRIAKDEKDDTQRCFGEMNDHRLFVHGSRMSNFFGILSTGIRLPHPTQVANGSVLGRGIYFADVMTKSVNYCRMEETDNIGFVALCEVALGDNPDIRETIVPMNEYAPESDQTSRWALGKTTIADEHYATLNTDDGFVTNVKVPQGPLTDRKDLGSSASFLYNEFVIFDTRQYRFRYLLKIRKV